MIFYFSGCGNSALVAKELAAHLNDDALIRIGATPSMDGYDSSAQSRIIWVFPVYSWGVPPIVLKWIKTVKLTHTSAQATPNFMVATCGDDAGYTDRIWRKAISGRGWRASSAYTVQMPNTYVSLPGFDVDKPEISSEKISKSYGTIAEISRRIIDSDTAPRLDDGVTHGSMPWIKSYVIRPFFMKFLTNPHRFRSTKECNGCGICARKCPMGNIRIHNHRPEWGTECAMCLGCYHRCPKHAITYGSATKNKGQYYTP